MTCWHTSFGTPMSRGCVNLTIDDAKWLCDWTYIGTEVSVPE
jgi:lipoprotein-anchoring transpeptidase ErfK/SrfK